MRKPWKGGAGQPAAPTEKPLGITRRSNGLRAFFEHLKGETALQVLDLGPASQANINFITGLGHRIFHEDLYPELAPYAYRAQAEGGGTRWDAEAFLENNLNYPEGLFDAVLFWDLLDFLPEPAAAQPVARRLGQITKPGGAVLVFFHTSEPGATVPVYRTQIASLDSLTLTPRAEHSLKRSLNNRNIENLFKQFHALKFFLTQDNLREVLAVR